MKKNNKKASAFFAEAFFIGENIKLITCLLFKR